MTLEAAGTLLKATYGRWSDHNAPRLGAALAYYALLSVSPLAMLLIALSGFILKGSDASRRILDQTRLLMGSRAANTLNGLIQNSQHRGSGLLATAIAIATLIFGASGVFVELRNALNTIWDVPEMPGGGWRATVRERLSSFLMVLGCGTFVLLSAIVSAAFAFLQRFATDFMPLSAAISGEVLNLVVSLILLAALFALIYKTVPSVPVSWRDVGIGAGFTAVLFVMGRALLSLYLAKAAVGSTYGAAGSVVALVAWVYYSAQIFFFGAVFTRVYSDFMGTKKAARTSGCAT